MTAIIPISPIILMSVPRIWFGCVSVPELISATISMRYMS